MGELCMSDAGNPFRWGILGTGAIASQFAAQLVLCGNASLHAVASQSNERAKAIASAWGGLPRPLLNLGRRALPTLSR
jgi:predicted dehydrogenase